MLYNNMVNMHEVYIKESYFFLVAHIYDNYLQVNGHGIYHIVQNCSKFLAVPLIIVIVVVTGMIK